MEIKFVDDQSRTHNTFLTNGKLTNHGKPVDAEQLAEFLCDFCQIRVNEHTEILSGEYVQLILPGDDCPDQLVIPEEGVDWEEAEEFISSLPHGTTVIMGSKYPKMQHVRVYHNPEGEWHIQLEVRLDCSDGDTIAVY